MSDIQNPNGFEIHETIDGVNDIMHIFQPGSGGTRRNKRIILDTLKVFFQTVISAVSGNIVTFSGSAAIQDSGVAVSDISNAYKGLNRVVLTNYTGTGKPAIAANSVCEINGTLYTNPSEVAITGSTVNTTWYDILLNILGGILGLLIFWGIKR